MPFELGVYRVLQYGKTNMTSGPHQPSDSAVEQYRALLAVSEAVISHRSLSELFEELAGRLRSLVGFDYVNVLLHDDERDVMRLHLLVPGTQQAARQVIQPGLEFPVEGSGAGWVWQTQQPLIVHDADEEARFPLTTDFFRRHGIHSFYAFPLTSAGRRLGTMGFGCALREGCSAESLEFLQQVVRQTAVAVENALNFETAASERDRRQLLLEVSNAVVSQLSLRDLLRAVSDCLRRFSNHDVASLVLYEEEAERLRVLALDPPPPGDVLVEGTILPLEGTPPGLAIRTRQTVMRERVDFEEFDAPQIRMAYEAGLRSGCSVPLISRERVLGAINVASFRESAFTREDAELLRQIADPVAVAVENTLNFERARAAEQEVRRKLERERLMLEINNAVVAHLDLKDLVRAVSAALRERLPHDAAGIALYDPEHDHLREYTNVSYGELDAFRVGDTIPLEGTPAGEVFRTGRPMLIRRPNPEAYPLDRYSQNPVEGSPKSACLAPLAAHGRKLGIAGVSSTQEGKFTEEDLELFAQITGQIAIAVENALNFEQATREHARVQTLLEVNNAIATNLDVRDLLRATSECLRAYFKHDFAALSLYDERDGFLHVHAFDRARPDTDIYKGEPVPVEGTLSGLAFTTRRAVYRSPVNAEETSAPMARRFFEQQGLQSFCCAPLVSRGRAVGIIALGSRQPDAMTPEDVELFERIGEQIAIGVENAAQYRQIEELKNKLASEKLYLEEEIKAEYNFGEIVGQSRALKAVLEQLKTVAPTDSVVFICGETGTGKELIARAIHNLSARRERTMVKVNCAAIPTGLLESEFFGHEKGAFTGAVTQRAGRFELANKGTLFLDEVGEIPLELQPKLLRVLQEHEFERLGGTRTMKVDVRLIAATNCNLREMVAEKKFRSDLFYRLNVFPITLPPLRERADDIPLLAGYFAQKHSRRMNKRVDSIPSETIEALCRYPWPGNVRELENFIERAVILTRGQELQAPLSELEVNGSADGDGVSRSTAPAPSALLSLADAERAHIEEVLRHTRGVVGGRGGAAEILGMPISTLRGRMKKLGLM
ncbi:MAG TPA: sigma 54-interacting transcriptional regulator [Pyrinomonadaceae bacterium]|nr:sigma 54-interacting transcriptional regulator [Pyrinomonadaceae bacterium]